MIRCIAEQHGAKNVRVFGSVGRGEAGPESDVGFLVDAGPVTSSWFQADWSPIWKPCSGAASTW